VAVFYFLQGFSFIHVIVAILYKTDAFKSLYTLILILRILNFCPRRLIIENNPLLNGRERKTISFYALFHHFCKSFFIKDKSLYCSDKTNIYIINNLYILLQKKKQAISTQEIEM